MNLKAIPRGLEITTAVGCKNACDYCPQRLLVRSNKKWGGARVMSWETFVQCIDKVPADVAIHFSGYCEPWQNPRCTDFVEYVVDRGREVSVFTTLYGMSENDVIRLSDFPLKAMVVHIPDANGSMKIDVDEDYLGILDLFARTTFECESSSCVLFGDPHPDVMGIIERANLWRMNSRAGNVDSSIKPEPSVLEGPVVCSKNRQFQNVLMPNGDVALCCMDYGLKHVIGNLVRHDYQSLHSGSEFRRVLEGMSGKRGDSLCRTCEWAVRVDGKNAVDRSGTVVGSIA